MDQTSEADRQIPFPGGLSPQAIRGMTEYVKKHYLDPNLDALSGRSYTEVWAKDNASVELKWVFSPPANLGHNTEPLLGKGVLLSIGPQFASIVFSGLSQGDEQSLRSCRRVADDIEVMANLCLSKAKTTSLYFIFSTSDRGSPKDLPATPGVGTDALKRLFSGNMMNLYLLIMAMSFGLFFVLGDLAIFFVIAIQLVALYYSDRIALLLGRVRPSATRPWVTIVCVPVAVEMKNEVAKLAKGLTEEITERLESRISGDNLAGPGATQAVQQILTASGIKSSTEEIKIVTRNVYDVVRQVADRFRLPVPKITIVNSVADNAAATGVSPSRSAITITAGSLEDLADPQLASVIGHELGHIRGRDSLILFGVTFVLYVGGLYLWYPLLLYLGLFYYILIFAIIFGVGKVLETRADTESASTLGQPEVLASALTSIGFRQLYVERYSHGARLLDWLNFDPHPPIYFRVQRLLKQASNGRAIGNTLLASIIDCARGFLDALF